MAISISSEAVVRGRREKRRGAVTAEFAITAPIFFLFLLVSFEFGWLNVIRHTADNAAYEAARIAMVPGATAADARAEANRILDIVRARGVTVTVTPSNIDPDTDEVTVEVDVAMNQNGLILPRFSAATNLHSEATLRTERAE